ncbi:hypothetical protein AXG93_107s1150 [Marchantia polymorpha subsp. ruderalis]|uniref:Uncharacterized protein n=1 Tax=Marchantia polymorpha subsp. ruderalis TaxID=1480154 RepID=A0A176WK71_MARPO|nr:hypothetical protein AXG93_107s1150 [Marchantia polymorpha subsp. ruderalis]
MGHQQAEAAPVAKAEENDKDIAVYGRKLSGIVLIPSIFSFILVRPLPERCGAPSCVRSQPVLSSLPSGLMIRDEYRNHPEKHYPRAWRLRERLTFCRSVFRLMNEVLTFRGPWPRLWGKQTLDVLSVCEMVKARAQELKKEIELGGVGSKFLLSQRGTVCCPFLHFLLHNDESLALVVDSICSLGARAQFRS